MFSARLIFALLAAAGLSWLWQSNHSPSSLWSQATQQWPFITHMASPTPTSASPLPQTSNPPPSAPHKVQTWHDADGTRHFAQTSHAPASAAQHHAGTPGTLADYESAVELQGGPSRQDIARTIKAQAAAAAAREKEQTTTAINTVSNGNTALAAEQQARQLIDRQAQALQQIRQANNH